MSTELLALAERCEQATGPDRDLDSEIAAALFRHNSANPIWASGHTPAYTASIDAALTLVPEGYHPNQTGGDQSADDEGRWYVSLFPNNDQPDEARMSRGSGMTFALAICAAALRARIASGIETRSAKTENTGLVRKDESPTAEGGDAQKAGQ